MVILQEVPLPLPRCNQCGMNMPAARLFKHRHTYNCKKSTESQLRRRDVGMSARCGDMGFSLYRAEGGMMVEVV